MRGAARILGATVVSTALFVVLLEILLRLFPQAVPLGLLKEFEPALRQSIAARRKLRTRAQTRLVARDDGGPASRMWIYKGGAVIDDPFDEPGIVHRVRADDMGFCNPSADAYDVAKLDVAALGDSFTWCTSVRPEDAWPAVLARATGLRTYNFGVPGRGLYEYLQILKAFGLRKSPRLVVLDVYEGNDLRDAFWFHQTRQDPRLGDAEDLCPFESAVLCDALLRLRYGPIGRRSYALNLIAAAPWYATSRLRRGDVDFRYDVAFADGRVVPFNTENADRDEVQFARRLHDGEIDLHLFDEALESFVALARAHDFVPFVVYTPSAHTTYAAGVRFRDPALKGLLHDYSDRQRRYFARRADELGYRFADLTPALREAAAALGADGLLYFRTNVHPTQRGHEIVAREVAKLIGPDANDPT